MTTPDIVLACASCFMLGLAGGGLVALRIRLQSNAAFARINSILCRGD